MGNTTQVVAALTQENLINVSLNDFTSIQNYQESINEMAVSQIFQNTSLSVSEFLQLYNLNYNIVSGGDVNLNLNSQQSIKICDINQIDQSFINEQYNKALQDMYGAIIKNAIQSAVSNASSSAAQSQKDNIFESLIPGFLKVGNEKPSSNQINKLNVNQSSEFRTDITNIQKNSNFFNFSSQQLNKFKNRSAQETKSFINVYAAGDVSIDNFSSQSISLLREFVQSLNLTGRLFSDLGNSQYLSVDQKLQQDNKTSATQTATATKESEGVFTGISGIIKEWSNILLYLFGGVVVFFVFLISWKMISSSRSNNKKDTMIFNLPANAADLSTPPSSGTSDGAAAKQQTPPFNGIVSQQPTAPQTTT